VTESDASRPGRGLRIAVVVSRYNDFVTGRLRAGALEALAACGVAAEDVAVVDVPGSFEIPMAARARPPPRAPPPPPPRRGDSTRSSVSAA